MRVVRLPRAFYHAAKLKKEEEEQAKVRERRPYATRKPKDYVARQPGDLVEIDVLEVHPAPGVVYKHLGARDVVSRWDVLGLYSRATAATAARAWEHTYNTFRPHQALDNLTSLQYIAAHSPDLAPALSHMS